MPFDRSLVGRSSSSIRSALSAVLVQAYEVVAQGVSLTVAAGLALGVITWLHLGDILARFDGSSILPTILMPAVVTEFGPMIVGLIAAGRLTAGATAELASMVVTEQVEALSLLGINPYRRLASPRIIAWAATLPLLTVLCDFSALLGSYSAEAISGSLSWSVFVDRGVDHLEPRNMSLCTLKTAVFGAVTSAIACRFGLSTGRSAEAIGRSVIGAVFWASLSVLIADVVLVALIQTIP